MMLNKQLVKNALSGHGWLGLFVAAAMYIICLSGALLVFHVELERWEQPNVPEFNSIDVEAMEATFNAYLETGDVTPHMYLILPTTNSPRARLATEKSSWFLNEDGSLGVGEENSWSEMLLNLHLYLHLPETWGMFIVSITGVMLVGLIVSGLLAHPGLFRDAFALRVAGSKQLEQTDIHNRLSVWGAPFFLMIAITGAYFGLAIPNLDLYAEVNFDGDRDRALSMLFGKEPTPKVQPDYVDVSRALDQMNQLAPEAEPFLIVLHDAGEPNQHVAISAFHPGRLVYSENYTFSTNGDYLGAEGFLDGPKGKQVVYSIYRLHFGTFAGAVTQWAYLILGLALTIVSVTGVNIWLAKRKSQDRLNSLWVGVVWGLPIGLCFSAALNVFFSFVPLITFSATYIIACLWSGVVQNLQKAKFVLRFLLGLAMIFLSVCHITVHGIESLMTVPLKIDVFLIVCGVVILLVAFWRRTGSCCATSKTLI